MPVLFAVSADVVLRQGAIASTGTLIEILIWIAVFWLVYALWSARCVFPQVDILGLKKAIAQY